MKKRKPRVHELGPAVLQDHIGEDVGIIGYVQKRGRRYEAFRNGRSLGIFRTVTAAGKVMMEQAAKERLH